MQAELVSLVTRIEQLEHRRRRGQRAFGLALLGGFSLTGLAFMARAPQDAPAKPTAETVRGSAFEVVDASGKVRARLGLDKDGAPELRLFDGRDKVRVRIGIHKDTEPILTLVDEEDKNRIAMVYDGNPHLLISRPGGKPVIHMTAATGGDACLLFTHIDGHHNSAIGLRANGDAILTQEKSTEPTDKGK